MPIQALPKARQLIKAYKITIANLKTIKNKFLLPICQKHCVQMKITILLFSLFFMQFVSAQVGIGTTSPENGYELEVNGSLLVQTEFKVQAFPTDAIQPSDQFVFRRLTSTPADGEVVVMDMTTLDRAPINVINYHFTNVYQDNLESVDLQYDADRYVVGLSNVRYVGETITKIGTDEGTYTGIGYFISRTYVEDGTWHLEIRNRELNAASNSNIEYYVTLIIYDKKYFKILNPISVNFNGATTGASTIPSGL